MRVQLRTLDLHDTSDSATALAAGFLEAFSRGFHAPRAKPELLAGWLEACRADRAWLRGAWLPEGVFGAGPMPVATFASFDKTLNTGAGLLPLRMITDITVSPAHRRQGWLRTMMEENLLDAVEKQVPLAALMVSEATIYGRFGFGAASWRQHIEVDTTVRFGLRGLDDPGRVEMVEPQDAWPMPEKIFTAFHERVRGSVDRPTFYGPLLRGEVSFDWTPGNDRLRGAVHLDAADRPDAYVLFHVDHEHDQGTVVVDDLVAVDPVAHLALWRFLADIDLTSRATMRGARVDDPLRWALTDAFGYRTSGIREHIWVRVLDVVTALEGRAWEDDGQVVLEVVDALGHAAGRFAVESRSGRASVEHTRASADLTLSAETLGALYLGGVRATTMHDAGRLVGGRGAVERFGRMSDAHQAPYSVTSF